MVEKQKPAQRSDEDQAAIDYAQHLYTEKLHRKWLWALIGRWTKWVLAAVAGGTILVDASIRVIKALGL